MTTPGRAGRDRPARGAARVPVPARFATAASSDGIVARLARPSPDRILVIAQAMRHGFADREIHAITRYDPWFLGQLRMIVEAEEGIRTSGVPRHPDALLRLKKLGFSGRRLARLAAGGNDEDGSGAEVGADAGTDGDGGEDAMRTHATCSSPGSWSTSRKPGSTADSSGMRRTALLKNVPYATTIPGARAMLDAISALREQGLEVAPLQSYGRETATG